MSVQGLYQGFTVPSFTFAGGVLSKGLYGRVDLAKYQTGLAYAMNFQVAVEGGADKRFGTYFTGKRKFQDKPSKLLPWRIANDDSYMLEFGDLYIRFIRFGGYVAIPGGHVAHADNEAANVSGFMELVTPYAAADVAKLKFTFANDTMRINHPLYPEQVITRLGLYDWKIDAEGFSPHPAGPIGGAAVYHNDTTADDNYVPEPIPTHYKVSATLSDGTETQASAEITVNADTGHRRAWVKITWTALAGAIQYTVYKGANGIFGFIGYTTTNSYEDRNFAPSYDVVPIGKKWDFPAGKYPRVSEFYKQRIVRASPPTEEQTLYISRPLVFNSNYYSLPSQDDDAIKAPLVGRERHTINHMIELKKFLIFTDTAEWVLETTQNAPMSAATIDPKIETHYGSHPDLKPVPIGDRILFIQSITGSVLDMGYEFTSDAFKADDLTRLARDLFKGKATAAWDYAKFPYNLMPLVQSDGTVNVMTYARENEIWGWTQYNTEGEFIDVACVEENSETAVYYQVKRTIAGVDTYFIERQFNYSGEAIEEMIYTDCALTYIDSLAFTAFEVIEDTLTATMTVADHAYEIGTELQLEDGVYICRVEVTAIDGDNLTVKLLRVKTWPEVPVTGQSLRCASTFTALDHLEGKGVWILADGKVIKELSIAVGAVTIAFKAARAHIGLPYYAQLDTLSLDFQNAAGTYKIRTIDEIIVHLRNSRGVLVGGINSDRDLERILPRNQESYYSANDPLNGAYPISAHASWDRTAAVRIRSEEPLPVHVLNIVPEIIYGS